MELSVRLVTYVHMYICVRDLLKLGIWGPATPLGSRRGLSRFCAQHHAMACQSLTRLLSVLMRCCRIICSIVTIAFEVGIRRCREIFDEEYYAKGDAHGVLVAVPVPRPFVPLAVLDDVCLHRHTTLRGSNMHKRRTTCLDCGHKWFLPA